MLMGWCYRVIWSGLNDIKKSDLPFAILIVLMGLLFCSVSLAQTAQQQPASDYFSHKQELFYRVVDLEIRDSGFNWRFARQYRSGLDCRFDGPLGYNWEPNYVRRLLEVNIENIHFARRYSNNVTTGDVIRFRTHCGPGDIYKKMPDGSYERPFGFDDELTKDRKGYFLETSPSSRVIQYSSGNYNGFVQMTRMTDAPNKSIYFDYDDKGFMKTVSDGHKQTVDYLYNENMHLIEVRAPGGKIIQFSYDEKGNLISVSRPPASGNGPTIVEEYSYSGGFLDERMNHDLLEVDNKNVLKTMKEGDGSAPTCSTCVGGQCAELHCFSDWIFGGKIGGIFDEPCDRLAPSCDRNGEGGGWGDPNPPNPTDERCRYSSSWCTTLSIDSCRNRPQKTTGQFLLEQMLGGINIYSPRTPRAICDDCRANFISDLQQCMAGYHCSGFLSSAEVSSITINTIGDCNH